MEKDNPFWQTYNPAHFCDRKKEIKILESNLFNGLNTLIHSPRRLGKSLLIRHLFHKIESEKLADTLYIDLFSTENMNDLIQALAEKVLQKFHHRNILQGLQQLLKGLSPTVSFEKDGTPKFTLEIHESQYQSSLGQIFEYLNKRKKKVFIAFDEFQEVAKYPEKAEAILRTHIQALQNVRFIFSGSTGHLLREMFLGAKHPFYQSAEVMVLHKIDREIYKTFITDTFVNNNKNIDPEAIDFILDYSDVYTYYTELICNHCFSQTHKILTEPEARRITSEYLEIRKFDYLNILNLMSENQRRLCIAIAKEGSISKPNSMEFIIKHKLPPASSINQALKVLVEKEILLKTMDGYKVYDVLFWRFLEKYY